MAEVEIPSEAPAWMLALEKKRQRVHRLAHEVGAGSPCLQCQDDCPGLDLHFWRKICRNCKCKKEDHDVIDDCGFEQFEILLGTSHSTNRPNKAFLEMLEKHTSAGFKNKMKSAAFDWVPPNVSPAVAAEYLQSLPPSKLPISGSDGALYRRQQLERQLPLHDLDANQCHQLTDTEVDNLKKYLENLKNNVVGQGRVTKLIVPSSNSLDSLQKISAFNNIPKPFQSSTGSNISSDSTPQFDVGGHIHSGPSVHLKPPSAFWPKSLSPEPFKSVSPTPDAPLPSLVDRGAAFGVTLSPASQRKTPMSKLPGINAPVGAQIMKDQTPKSVVQSMNVPGSMWVPAECTECSRKGVDSQLVRDEVCVHMANSSNVNNKEQHTKCLECVSKGLGDQMIGNKVCTHMADESLASSRLLPSQCLGCVECAGKSFDGQLVRGQVCSHIANSQDISYPVQPSETQVRTQPAQTYGSLRHASDHSLPSDCSVCANKYVDGVLVRDQVCSHIALKDDVPLQIKPGQVLPLDDNAKIASSVSVPAHGTVSGMISSLSQDKLQSLGKPSHLSDHSLDEDSCVKGLSPIPQRNWNEDSHSNSQSNIPGDGATSTSLGSNLAPIAVPGLKVHSSSDYDAEKDDGLPSNKSPTNVMSSMGAPHKMALYAHNALNSPSTLDPQNILSPHVASMSIDDGMQSGSDTKYPISQFPDPIPPVDLELHCMQCNEDICPGEVVVFADRAGPEIVWHPKCFVCNTCQELLVDLVYFYEKGRVYCGRHYAEILDIPRCSACDELIFVKEYTVAEGQAFHVKHFCCFECDEPLGGKQYVPKDSQPVCLPCFERKYGKQCETCHLMIGAQDQRVTWKDLHWHATPVCFCCDVCQKSLLGGRFAVKDQRPFCSKECMQAGLSTSQKVSAV